MEVCAVAATCTGAGIEVRAWLDDWHSGWHPGTGVLNVDRIKKICERRDIRGESTRFESINGLQD